MIPQGSTNPSLGVGLSLSKVKTQLPNQADVAAFGKLAGCQLIQYFIYSFNARCLAQGRIGWTFFTDLLYAFVTYYVIKWVGENNSIWGRTGYVLGGAWGSLFAIMLTKAIFKQ